jgi:hypothetical protein
MRLLLLTGDHHQCFAKIPLARVRADAPAAQTFPVDSASAAARTLSRSCSNPERHTRPATVARSGVRYAAARSLTPSTCTARRTRAYSSPCTPLRCVITQPGNGLGAFWLVYFYSATNCRFRGAPWSIFYSGRVHAPASRHSPRLSSGFSHCAPLLFCPDSPSVSRWAINRSICDSGPASVLRFLGSVVRFSSSWKNL